MNTGQERIQITILLYTLFWNTRYFWEKLPGDMLITVILFIVILVLLIVGLFQLGMYLTESFPQRMRLINAGLILLISVLTFYWPLGLFDFQKLEGENKLYAFYEGTASCSTQIRLKKGNKCKKTFVCFGVEHQWGTYVQSHDTIYFHFDRDSERNDIDNFAVIELERDTTRNRLGVMYYHSKEWGGRGIPMVIKEYKR